MQNNFNFWISEISPNVAPYAHKLNVKLVSSSYIDQLDDQKYNVYLRAVKNQIKIYREENISLFTKMQQKQQVYGAICAKMTIDHNGETLTLQQASQLLKFIQYCNISLIDNDHVGAPT